MEFKELLNYIKGVSKNYIKLIVFFYDFKYCDVYLKGILEEYKLFGCVYEYEKDMIIGVLNLNVYFIIIFMFKLILRE